MATGDAKRVSIEQKLTESEMLRKELVKKVAYFENSARRALSFASKLKFQQILSTIFDNLADSYIRLYSFSDFQIA